jgi:hypothetical protein
MVPGTISIIGEDAAGEAVGIVGFMPSSRYLALAVDEDHAARLKAIFRDRFAVEVEHDWSSQVIGRRLGLVALAFRDDLGRVRASEGVIEASDVEEARSQLSQSHPATDRGRPEPQEPIR